MASQRQQTQQQQTSKNMNNLKKTFVTEKGVFVAHEKDDVLGRGTYGVVYRAHLDTDPSIKRAVKIFSPDTMDEAEGIPSTTLREINALKTIAHPNVMTAEEVVIPDARSPNDMFFIMELCKGTLKDKVIELIRKYLQSDPLWINPPPDARLPEAYIKEAKIIAWQLLNSLAVVHSRGIMHRDLKPVNILWGFDDLLKLADFGLARFVRGNQNTENSLVQQTGEVQTMWYRAPEVLLGDEKYGLLVDDWSLGCVIAELFRFRRNSAGRVEPAPLFQGRSDIGTLMIIFETLGTPQPRLNKSQEYLGKLRYWCEGYPSWTKGNLKSRIPLLDELGFDLLEQLLCLSPSQRKAARFLLDHPWFNDVRPQLTRFVPWYRGFEDDYKRMMAVDRLPLPRTIREAGNGTTAVQKDNRQEQVSSTNHSTTTGTMSNNINTTTLLKSQDAEKQQQQCRNLNGRPTTTETKLMSACGTNPSSNNNNNNTATLSQHHHFSSSTTTRNLGSRTTGRIIDSSQNNTSSLRDISTTSSSKHSFLSSRNGATRPETSVPLSNNTTQVPSNLSQPTTTTSRTNNNASFRLTAGQHRCVVETTNISSTEDDDPLEINNNNRNESATTTLQRSTASSHTSSSSSLSESTTFNKSFPQNPLVNSFLQRKIDPTNFPRTITDPTNLSDTTTTTTGAAGINSGRTKRPATATTTRATAKMMNPVHTRSSNNNIKSNPSTTTTTNSNTNSMWLSIISRNRSPDRGRPVGRPPKRQATGKSSFATTNSNNTTVVTNNSNNSLLSSPRQQQLPVISRASSASTEASDAPCCPSSQQSDSSVISFVAEQMPIVTRKATTVSTQNKSLIAAAVPSEVKRIGPRTRSAAAAAAAAATKASGNSNSISTNRQNVHKTATTVSIS